MNIKTKHIVLAGLILLLWIFLPTLDPSDILMIGFIQIYGLQAYLLLIAGLAGIYLLIKGG